MMHDDYVVSYSVSIENRTIQIQTCNSEKTIASEIEFEEVLTHSFKCVLENQNNILYDIDNFDISTFIEYNSEELNRMEKQCWPIYYHSIDELGEYLIKNQYKYYRISSSIGMYGWVLAKALKINEKPICRNT